MSKKIIDREYKNTEVYDSISKTFDENREDPLIQNDDPKYRIPVTLTYNRTSPNLKEAVKKHWNLLQIKNKVKDVLLTTKDVLLKMYYKTTNYVLP